MSLNSDTEKGSVAAPRLAPASGAGYATWAPRMAVFLQQRGAEGIHLKEMSEAAWSSLSAKVAAWHEADFAAALELATGSGGSASSSTPASASASGNDDTAGVLSREVKESRKLLVAVVER